MRKLQHSLVLVQEVQEKTRAQTWSPRRTCALLMSVTLTNHVRILMGSPPVGQPYNNRLSARYVCALQVVGKRVQFADRDISTASHHHHVRGHLQARKDCHSSLVEGNVGHARVLPLLAETKRTILQKSVHTDLNYLHKNLHQAYHSVTNHSFMQKCCLYN